MVHRENLRVLVRGPGPGALAEPGRQCRPDAASCGAGRGRRFAGYAAVPAALRHYVELIGIIVGGRAWA